MLNYTSLNLRKVNVMDVLKLRLMPGPPTSESADSDCLFMYCFPHAFWLRCTCIDFHTHFGFAGCFLLASVSRSFFPLIMLILLLVQTSAGLVGWILAYAYRYIINRLVGLMLVYCDLLMHLDWVGGLGNRCQHRAYSFLIHTDTPKRSQG